MTIFYGLFQGEFHGDESAILLGVFSSQSNAASFIDTELSPAHTELKRQANYIKQARDHGDLTQEIPDVPDFYWDIRPVALDPRGLEELL